MHNIPYICPAILSSDFSDLTQLCENISKSGALLIHADVMDGHFAPALTFGHSFCNTIALLSDIPVEVHFAVTQPLQYTSSYNLDNIERFIFHIETLKISDFIEFQKSHPNILLGVIRPTLNSET